MNGRILGVMRMIKGKIVGCKERDHALMMAGMEGSDLGIGIWNGTDMEHGKRNGVDGWGYSAWAGYCVCGCCLGFEVILMGCLIFRLWACNLVLG